jgi:hypothetical protein
METAAVKKAGGKRVGHEAIGLASERFGSLARTEEAVKSTAKNYFTSLRRRTPARPIKPEPNRTSEPGSGVGFT